jgi:2,3-bisphosphoglycerate-dependent phosphoglycerate mutase
MSKLYLVRHATTDWNAEHRWQGIRDIPLNDKGRAQIERLGDAFAGIRIDRICASDLSRARETAEAVQKATGAPLELYDTLRERSFGRWEGHTSAELEVKYPGDMEAYRANRNEYSPPGGQSWSEFAKRAVVTIEELAEKYSGERLAIVSHGGTIRAFINHVMGTERGRMSRFRLDNASVSVVNLAVHEMHQAVVERWWQIMVLNQTSHLNGALPA